MRSQITKKTVTIYPEGRMDSDNADIVKQEIKDCIEGSDCKSVIIDASGLSYISSAGLRVVLFLKKEYEDLSVINASPEVYDIFETTGFTSMIKVYKPFKNISVENCPVIGKGACGTVYRVDKETVVKVYQDPDIKKVLRERDIAKKAFVLGIPTAISYDIVRVNGLYASVFEMLDARSMATLLRENLDDIDKYVDMYVSLMRSIHELRTDDDSFPYFKDFLINNISKYKEMFSPKDLKSHIAFIESMPDSDHLIHGDFHINNIMCKDNGEIMLIDLERLGRGDPLFEFALNYISFMGMAEIDPGDNERFLGIKKETAEYFYMSTLKKYYKDEFSDELFRTIRRIAYLKMIVMTGKRDRLKKESYRIKHEYFQKNMRTLM